MTRDDHKLTLEDVQRRLADKGGREYWRSFEELAETAPFQELMRREFPLEAEIMETAPSRREVLKLVGASLALAGLTGCTDQPKEKIIPYVEQPEQLIPGKPLYFATATTLAGYARGVLAESHMGRPTKLEGNPDHPATLGKSDAFTQAEILALYDPDRSKTVTGRGPGPRTWQRFLSEMRLVTEVHRANGGQGLRILTGAVTSPTLRWQIEQIIAKFPQAQWHRWEAFGRDNERIGLRWALGREAATQHRFDRANVVVSLDSDFMYTGPAAVRYMYDFAQRRRVGIESPQMNRLYAVEASPTVTGIMADERLPARAAEVEAIARALARRVGVDVPAAPHAIDEAWLERCARDLTANRGRCVVVAGEEQPPSVHALAAAMNQALGAVGDIVTYTEPVEAGPVDGVESLRRLTDDMRAGRVTTLVTLHCNPVETAPDDLDFAGALSNVQTTVHLGLYEDETGAIADWHIPATHSLESWGDARAYDGTVTIIQPLIAPLYRGRSEHELLAVLSGTPDREGFQVIQDYWKTQWGPTDFPKRWRRALHDGVVEGTAFEPISATLAAGWEARLPAPADRRAGLEVVFRPDRTTYDGRFANNAWLQELPDPITKLTWDNAVLVAPTTALELGLENERVVELSVGERSLRGPVWIVPGQAESSLTVHLGYGRRSGGRIAFGSGFRGYQLRTSDAMAFATGVALKKTRRERKLATTQDHWAMEGRYPVHFGTLTEFRRHPKMHPPHYHHTPKLSLYPEYEYDSYKWGMVIDLTTCTGCGTCTIACQAENNIPTVGKDGVLNGREMHWIRVDRYFHGAITAPKILPQPVPCMQCENAPCEYVCPVHATVHSSEGLNDMVYNRCVGTRYCSNNCPYKVRRFNFYQYQDVGEQSLMLLRNPDVTVRSRGVMEKCTYCVQRINNARIEAKKEDRSIREGEVQTACQQACPADAIIFGDLNDPNSRVQTFAEQPQNYGLLDDLNTRPRTTYLARVFNPKEG